MDSAKREKPGFWGVAPYQRPSADEVTETQRRRLLLGITRAVAKKGYAEASVADVLTEVRVSRRTFYELFRDKEECYLAAYEVAHLALIDAIKSSQRGAADALGRVDKAHQAYLSFIQQEPELASAFFVGILEAGPRAFELRQRAFLEFADMHAALHRQCREQHRELPEIPKRAFVALTAGTHVAVVEELRRRGPDKLMDLLPTILYLSYSVYGLHAQAAAALSKTPARTARTGRAR
jgi:AcrR family transcriptional regulator